MRSSEPGPLSERPETAATRGAGPVFLWFGVLGNAVMGLGLTTLALGMFTLPVPERSWSTTVSLVLAVVGVLWFALGSVGFHRTYLHRTPVDGRSVRVTTVDGAPAVVLPWERLRRAIALLTTGFVTLGLLGVAMAFHRNDDPGGEIPLVLGLLAGFAVPDGVLSLTWAPRVVLTPERLTVRGWYSECSLAWDDVVGIETVPTSREVLIRVIGRPGSPSWQAHRRRPRLLPTRRPTAPDLELPQHVVDVLPTRLTDALLTWARVPSTRAELGTEAGRRRLLEPGTT